MLAAAAGVQGAAVTAACRAASRAVGSAVALCTPRTHAQSLLPQVLSLVDIQQQKALQQQCDLKGCC